MAIEKWGGAASLMLIVAFIVPELVYLMGNLRAALGPLTYSAADFLYGPLKAACLVVAVYALREHMGERASRRMALALLIALAAASAFVAVAAIRAANRHYHLTHPELHLESSTIVLVVWATLVAGAIGTAWHLLGWGWVLVGWSGWTSGRLPRLLSGLYLAGGALSLFVYVLPDVEGTAAALSVVVSLWLGVVLWRAEPGEAYSPNKVPLGRPNE